MTSHQTVERLGALVALVGPTAVGKSEFALRLAERLPVEIINADSRQVYRYMDIGTSKPSPEARERVPHHVFDVVDPDQEFSLAVYLELARSARRAVVERYRTPIVVGGTGQYVWSLVEEWQLPEVPPDPSFRRDMEEYAATHGAAALHARLAGVDDEAARRIQATNVRRVIRALELHRATDTRPSALLRRRQGIAQNTVVIGLKLDRPLLVARAERRIDRMIREGFPGEVKLLLEKGYSPSLPSMSSIGYREMADYVNGRCDLQTTVSRVKRETHRLIRRQRSWFRPSDTRIEWLDCEEYEKAIEQAIVMIQGLSE